MKKNEIISIVIGLSALLSWLFEGIPRLYRFLMSIAIVLIILLLALFNKKSFFQVLKKYVVEIFCFVLVGALLFYIKTYNYNLLLPLFIMMVVNIVVSFLLLNKYISQKEPEKFLLAKIDFDNKWNLNFPAIAKFASIQANKLIYEGTTPVKEIGSNVTLTAILTVGTVYEVACIAKSAPNTTGKLQLCLNDTEELPNGSSAATGFKTPAEVGEILKIEFPAMFNSNLRIHFQYRPGNGKIEISQVRVYELLKPC